MELRVEVELHFEVELRLQAELHVQMEFDLQTQSHKTVSRKYLFFVHFSRIFSFNLGHSNISKWTLQVRVVNA